MFGHYSLKSYLGALLYDVPTAVSTGGRSNANVKSYPWVRMKNRNEHLIKLDGEPGVHCNWEWTSNLYLPKVFPSYGRWLYRRAFKDFPVALKEHADSEIGSDHPQVSFIIGHRGKVRLPLLLATLKSIAAQKGCTFECVVVEQDNKPLLKDALPDWVRYVHTPPPQQGMAYSRACAFNVGANIAKADFLIFHDNDMLVPEVYANEHLNYYRKGFEVINLKRFIFFLDKESSNQLCRASSKNISPGIVDIMQNAEGGGSIGISRLAFDNVGGFDERFVGWGGEDNEFWERASTRKFFPYGYLPIVHLWHERQIEKYTGNENENAILYHKLHDISPEERIKQLIKIRNPD